MHGVHAWQPPTRVPHNPHLCAHIIVGLQQPTPDAGNELVRIPAGARQVSVAVLYNTGHVQPGLNPYAYEDSKDGIRVPDDVQFVARFY